jgi:isoaspartyl peptidase/L-asparaginase-like protein (Ntn-hydrolase superfamily)
MPNQSASVLVIHGGAGVLLDHDYGQPAAFMAEILSDGGARLAAGAAALDLVVDMVAAMEASGLFTAGRGASVNQAGDVELDATLMDGPTRQAGAVAAVRNVVYPVRLARAVMERTPHVMLAGLGAEQFAKDSGMEMVSDPAAYYRSSLDVTGPGADRTHDPLAHGTVGAVALDGAGRLAAATSTGGTLNKMPGRVGDSPIIGAGCWADDQVAVSATGQGEFFIRTVASHDVAARVAYLGVDLTSAADAVIDAVGRLNGEGGLIAVDRNGQVAMPFNTDGMKRGVVRAGGSPVIEVRR